MSYVAGSEPRDLLAIAGGVAAVFGGLEILRRRDRARIGSIVAVCSDGSVIGAWQRGLRRRPGRPPRRGLDRFLPWRGRVPGPRPIEDLEPGDLSHARVREGREGEAAWVVEGLDRGSEPFRIHWEFETPDAAVAAFRMIVERIARPPLDGAGRPVELSESEFDSMWEAR
jgi:hypothetical protein